ncbi:MAG TPA: amidohydrolase family protein [Flexivirga sp.]|uniref:amidohydrolase family protein n=1 Tax=Flexivirga sp. TaxID=1962927 RepID=UPI002CF197AB|nr:amidohydrolase family protein [Flexivirga sp.]HWC22823.1 amidohydrolase family protein [Flexivirga sp.]
MSIELHDLHDAIAGIGLVDHHVHGSLRGACRRDQFESLITESDRPVPAWMTQFDSQVGFAIRRHCAPVLGLAPNVEADSYWSAREAFTADELTSRFLGSSGVAHWLMETGYRGDEILTNDELTGLLSSPVSEVVRLESVLESVAPTSTAAGLRADFCEELARRTATAVGLKSIVAYRYGFDFDPTPPSDQEVTDAAGRWLRECEAGDARVADPVLLRMLLWEATETGLPLQLHAGYGDPDVELHRCDPLLLTRWLKAVEPTGMDVLLLHCYPFHRNAGYLAQVFPHVYFDVGLAINYTGARSAQVIAESLELAPFAKILYSSDAWGPPELHYLGATLWRQGMETVLGGFVDRGEWAADDAMRVAWMVGRENAQRVYGVRQ